MIPPRGHNSRGSLIKKKKNGDLEALMEARHLVWGRVLSVYCIWGYWRVLKADERKQIIALRRKER